jgi:hypothetical protein
MKSTAILDLMVKDHIRIMKLIKDIEEIHEQDITKINNYFNNFKWNLEKHFFVEERAIFTFYNPEKVDEGYEIFLNLSEEHTKILKKVEEIEKKLQNWNSFEFKELKKMLIKHKNLEENKLYPILDKEIAEGEKQFMIQRIKDVSING